MSFAPETEALAKPEVLLRVPVGLSSPLWGLFAGAAVSGATWWWMTRWVRPENLEAMFGAVAKTEDTLASEFAAVTEPLVEAVVQAEPVAIVETVVEAVTHTEPVELAETIAELTPEPVGGEAAPVSPVLEALAPDAVVPELAEPQIPEIEAAQLGATVEMPAEAVAEMAPKAKKGATPKPA
ncbi:MAG TPA: hypothetical protein VGH86_00905 [Phenylobacterium sp.]